MALLPLAQVDLEVEKTDEHIVSVPSEIPKNEMDIFYRAEESFLPEGKTWADLTEKEIAEIRSRYRFDPLRPGTYQGITGIGQIVHD